MSVEGVALVRIEPKDHPDFVEKLRKFRNGTDKDGHGWDTTVTIGAMRPVYRVYTEYPKDRKRIKYNVIINVTASTEEDLIKTFRTMEGLGCHIDGFGG